MILRHLAHQIMARIFDDLLMIATKDKGHLTARRQANDKN
jgi:hypothetical protein